MKYQESNRTLITFLQILASMMFAGFVYYQTQLINGLGDGAVDYRFLYLTFGFVGAYLLLEIFENYVREKLFALHSAGIRRRAVQAFFRQGAVRHGEKNDEQHLSFLVNEVGAVLEQNLYLRLYEQKQLITLIAAVLTLVIISRGCSLLVIFVAVIYGVGIRFLSGKLKEKQGHLQSKKATFVEKLMELNRGFEEIHINQMENMAEQEFQRANEEAEEAQYRYRAALARLELMSVGQNMMMYIVILICGGALASRGQVGVGIFVSAAELAVQALNQWTAIAQIHSMVKGSELLKKNLDAYLCTENEPFWQVEAGDGEVLLRMSGVNCQYEESNPLLNDIDLSVCRGKKYLIVGESGCGKSTLLEVMTGHKNCSMGKIHYYTDKIAYLPQEPFLFQGTLRENLVFGNERPDGDIEEMLKKLKLEISLDAMIEANGENLSGGQKARVALGRALLMNPEVLIVDEITANLDIELGEQLEKLLLEEYPRMALCAVAHRFYCRDKYDVIIEIRQGKVCEVAR